ncbi:secreted protein [gut metagenome]|uniref:Secreted protein n=1 Tax=gut metagenome TaxID=749906 RepID=J9GHB5_9ZZZZ
MLLMSINPMSLFLTFSETSSAEGLPCRSVTDGHKIFSLSHPAKIWQFMPLPILRRPLIRSPNAVMPVWAASF